MSDPGLSPGAHLAARRAAGLVISLVALAGCGWWALHQDAPQFPESLDGLSLLVLAVGLCGLNMVLRGWRWHIILGRANVEHRRADAFGLTLVGYMGNTVLPARGGELLRILMLSERSSARRIQILGSIIPERLLDAITAVVVFCGLAAAGVAGSPGGRWLPIAGAASVVFLLAAMRVYLRLRVRGRFERFAERVRPVASASRPLLSRTGGALACLSAGLWFIDGTILLVIARAIGVHVSLPAATLAVSAAALSSMIPALPGYVGTFDAAMLVVLHALEVRGGAATSVLLLYRFVVFVPITAAGLFVLITKYGRGDLLWHRRAATESAAGAG